MYSRGNMVKNYIKRYWAGTIWDCILSVWTSSILFAGIRELNKNGFVFFHLFSFLHKQLISVPLT